MIAFVRCDRKTNTLMFNEELFKLTLAEGS